MSGNDKRDNVVTAYLTGNEHDIFISKVMQSNLSQAEFIRRKVMEDEANKPGQFMLDQLIELDRKVDTVCRKMLKQEYVIKKLAAAILVERTSNELVTEFVSKMEEEAEELYGKS